MKLYGRYLFKSLLTATIFIALTLAMVILLTQSLRFLELIMDSGASSLAYLTLSVLALPRFFEVVLPLALMAAVLFVYNKMIMDSEIIVFRAVGLSPMAVARPAIVLSLICTALLVFSTAWLAPVSLAKMQQMRQVVKAQLSSVLFREGVFNVVGKGLMVYVKERRAEGELIGLIMHDTREEGEEPVTIVASRGVNVLAEQGQQIIVFDGSRQQFDPERRALSRLDFDQYTIDLPDQKGDVRQRWKEPEERTLYELLNPDMNHWRDRDNIKEFRIEAQKRIITPFLCVGFVMVALSCLLLGSLDRRGLSKRVLLALGLIIVLEGLYLASFNIARQSLGGIVMMYATVFLPILIGAFALSGLSEGLRTGLLQRKIITNNKKRRGEAP